MALEGIPSRPIILFWSGDLATLVRLVNLKIGNEFYSRIYMIPSEQMKWRYEEIKKQLQYKYGHVSGFIVREYPQEYVYEITSNPELPLVVVLCNFDGTISLDTELHKLKDAIRRLKKDNNNLRAEIEILREKYKEQIEYLREIKVPGVWHEATV